MPRHFPSSFRRSFWNDFYNCFPLSSFRTRQKRYASLEWTVRICVPAPFEKDYGTRHGRITIQGDQVAFLANGNRRIGQTLGLEKDMFIFWTHERKQSREFPLGAISYTMFFHELLPLLGPCLRAVFKKPD